MKVIIVETPFKHAENGIEVNEYEKGEHLVSERCAEVAIKHLKAAKASKKTPEEFEAEQAKEAE